MRFFFSIYCNNGVCACVALGKLAMTYTVIALRKRITVACREWQSMFYNNDTHGTVAKSPISFLYRLTLHIFIVPCIYSLIV